MRRLVFFIPAIILTLIGWYLAWDMMDSMFDSPLSILFAGSEIVLFGLLFALLATTSWAAFLGLGLWLLGRRRVPLEREAMAIPQSALRPSTTSRTALLIPAYHEDPHEVFSRVRTMHAGLTALQPEGTTSDIDIFILSDSQNPEAVAEEAQTYRACIAALNPNGPTVYYRRREQNTEYKVGNIKEFCLRWGNAYDHLLVLDADSLMSAETMRRMIMLMERHPRVGLLQTCFIPIGRDTLFCRIMQFSTRLYLMPAAMGLEFWQGANANYWGHNALLRTRAFMESCGLPELPGKAPLGGRILSHDIVEAAFIARAGWEAWLLPNMPGTYEELPTNLIDFMQRDRRWCAGNLQHQHVIRADNIPFGNRMHMSLGIMAYATGPLWLGFILFALVGTVFGISHGGLQLATAGYLTTSESGQTLFQLTLILLFGPKLLTLALALVRPSVCRSFGGPVRLLVSAVLEQAFLMLQQPAVMLFYTTFIIRPLLGRVVKWEAQPRSERGIGWYEAILRHRNHMALGAVLAVLASFMASNLSLIGVLPVIVGLLLSPAFTVLTSRASLGQRARRMGLFLTVDELTPASEVKALQKALAHPLHAAQKPLSLPKLPPEVHGTMHPQPLRYPKAQSTAVTFNALALDESPIPINDR